MLKRLVILTLAVGILVSFSACSSSTVQYEYAVDVVSPTWESRIDLTELQSVLDERGDEGWELVTFGQALVDNNAGTVAVFKRPIRQ